MVIAITPVRIRTFGRKRLRDESLFIWFYTDR